MKIGFIGLGIMGKPMVRNIMKAGYTDVLVWNRSKAPMDEVAADGAVASNPKEIGENCDVVITMLPLVCFRKIIYNKGKRRDCYVG